MARTRIKICGITRAEDAALAAELGADAIGLNFVGGPRQINLILATSVLRCLRELPFAPMAVALCGYRCPELPDCLTGGEVVAHLTVQCLQVYGLSEARLYNGEDSIPYWFVSAVGRKGALADLSVLLAAEGLFPQAVVLDTASAEKRGGTGQAFNWNWIAEAREAGELAGVPPIILAGGLHPGNVAEAIRIARPYAVDVSSGVEVAGKPGVKDAVKMRDFVQAVQGA
jgi:phosphoribosylanthranilate isomerase